MSGSFGGDSNGFYSYRDGPVDTYIYIRTMGEETRELNTDGEFSLIQEHYLKRELLRLEIDREVSQLNDFKDIGKFGPPFVTDLSKGSGNVSADGSSYPILQYMFHNCVTTFPFVKNVDEEKFWQQRVQRFLEDFAQKDISTSADRTEETKRRRIALKIKKMIFLYTASGIQTTRGEKDSKIQRVSDGALQKIDHKKIISESLQKTNFINGYDVNVAGVRQISVRRGFLYEDQTEYLIKTQAKQEGSPVVFVARKYSDFKALDKKLRKEFPGKQLPSLPSKNKSSTSAGGLMSWARSENSNDDDDGEEPDDEDLEEDDEGDDDKEFDTYSTHEAPSLGPKKLSKFIQQRQANEMSENSFKLVRERQRTTLRGYLRELLKSPQISRCQTFLEFLHRDKLKKLTKEELYDMEMRKKMDLIRTENQIKFYEIATERAKLLEEHINEFKQEILKKDGLLNMFKEIRDRESIKELSPQYQKFAEWCVIEFAATLYHMFMAEDNSPEFYSQIRRIHKMLPYSMLRGILHYSNPMAMMKGILDLFLAQPFGRRSLLQNIFWVILGDDAKAQEKLISELRATIVDVDLMKILDGYVRLDSNLRQQVKERAGFDRELVVVIFESTDLMKTVVDVAPKQVERIQKMHDLWNKVVDGELEGVSERDRKLVDSFSQLKEYLKLIVRKRDKEMMQEFWSDGISLDMIRELITIFYTPLIKVFKSANIHESVADFERFMDDLIKVVDKAEMTSASSDPNQLVESFIKLCERHQEGTFKFIHNVYKHDDGLFNGFTQWVGGIIEFLRVGNGRKLDMESLFKQAQDDPNIDHQLILTEINSVIQYMQERRSYRDRIAATGSKKNDDDDEQNAWHEAIPGVSNIQSDDFGLHEDDLDDLRELEDDNDKYDESPLKTTSSSSNSNDYIESERQRRKELLQRVQSQAKMQSSQKPDVVETRKLLEPFYAQLGNVLGRN